MLMMMNQPVCRCCLLENPKHTYSIFDDKDLRIALLECLPPGVNIEPCDGLPETICERCRLLVREMAEFRREWTRTDQELRRRYEDAKKTIDETLSLDVLTKLEREMEDIIIDKLNISADCGVIGERAPEDTQDLSAAFENVQMSILDDVLLEDTSFSSLPDSGYDTNSYKSESFFNEFLSPMNQTARNDNLLRTEETPKTPVQFVAKKLTPSVSTLVPEALPAIYTDSMPGLTDATAFSKSKHSCPQCEKTFTRNFQLKLHMMSVHQLGDGRQYKCGECQKTFASRHSLNYHQKSMHSSDRPHECEVCQRRFILRSQLASHSRVHTGEAKPRVFECSQCDKRWPTRSDLRTHMRSHDPNVERPFKCDRCEKCFFTRGHLNSHLLVHTGQKPFSCSFCDRTYQNVSNLNNHLVRRHAEALLNKKYQQQQQQQQQQSYQQQQQQQQQAQILAL